MVLDSQLAEWINDIHRLTDQVHKLVDPLSAGQLLWRAAPGKWSVAECLEHLSITASKGGEHWTPAVERALVMGKRGKGPFGFGWLGGWFIGQVGPQPKRPMKAPAVFAPPATIDARQAVIRFFATQEAIEATMRRANGLDLGRVRARSAVTPLFRFNLATWFASTVAHERRHFDQMQRVTADAAFPES